MRGSYRSFEISVMICAGICLSLSGYCLAQEDNFYGRGKEGWYWYKDEIREEVVMNDQKAVLNKRQPDNFTYQQLWNMDPDQFKAVLMERQKLAIQETSEQNVLSFLVAHEIAKRKSSEFAMVATRLIKQYGLDRTAEKSATNIESKSMNGDLDRVLIENSGDFALLVFERAGCHYCEDQRPAVELFSQTFGWIVKHLDIDQYGQMANQYQIDITPSIIMISRSASIGIEISKGLMSFDEIKGRVLEGIAQFTQKIDSGPAPEAEPGLWQRNLRLVEGHDWRNHQ
jgi:conjugal transfer pilus assembly protein TraF